MTEVDSAPTAGGWRFRLGIICFIAAFAIHLVTLVAMLAGAGPGTVAAIAAMNFALNKILLLATVALLGKSGFNQLKQMVLGAIGRYAPPQEVGPRRYSIGLVLFVIPILIGWVGPYLGDLVPLLRRYSVSAAIVGDIILLFSLFVLGGNFWDKLRALFIREARVVYPEKAAAA
ncbi:MAG TPA: hypothetical protein VHK26_10130 [Methyloceanibacter sp.]|jgi:hypothetical protein|nr:hypothetical protein [Methyloceanibacter sp.]